MVQELYLTLSIVFPDIFTHPVFNFLSIPQGLLFSTTEFLKSPLDLARLWMHESERVYGDKLVDDRDIELFNRHLLEYTKKYFEVSIQEVSAMYSISPSPGTDVARLCAQRLAHTQKQRVCARAYATESNTSCGHGQLMTVRKHLRRHWFSAN